MNWKDGGDYGLLCRAITNEAGNRAIAKVWTKRAGHHRNEDAMPWPEGEANFRLILAAPELAHTLHELLWEMVTMSDMINREDPGMMDAIANHEFETDHVRACQQARELLAQLGMTGPPKGENDV